MSLDSVHILTGWLRRLPERALVRWGDDGLTPTRRFASRAVDPVVDDCPVAWPWHVLGPDDPDIGSLDAITLIVPYDLDTFEVWPGGPCHGPLASYCVGRDRPLDVVTAAALANLRALPGAMLSVAGGWRPRTISSALSDWAAIFAGRSDLTFHWDAHQRSTVMHTFGRQLHMLEAARSRHHEWCALQPAAPRILPFEDDVCEDGDRAWRARRVVEADRWARRATVDPALNWLTPAEVAALLHLRPGHDATAWCLRHGMPSRPGAGLEPVFAAGPVLALARDQAWPGTAAA
jgi:hypothetical protein